MTQHENQAMIAKLKAQNLQQLKKIDGLKKELPKLRVHGSDNYMKNEISRLNDVIELNELNDMNELNELNELTNSMN